MKNFGALLKKLMLENGFSKKSLADKIGVSHPIISAYIKGTSKPRDNTLIRLSAILKVKPSFFGNEFKSLDNISINVNYNSVDTINIIDSKLNSYQPNSVKLFVYGSTSCGDKKEILYLTDGFGTAETRSVDISDLPEEARKIKPDKIREKYFIFIASGNSMSPRILPGDELIFEKCDDIPSGKIGLIQTEDYETQCKRIIKEQDRLVLKSNNIDYQDIIYEKENIKKITIIGKFLKGRYNDNY